jgi:predicted aconitase with swiveling domain
MRGTGEREALVTIHPINFFAMVNAKTCTVTDPLDELYDKSVKGSANDRYLHFYILLEAVWVQMYR